MGEAVVVRGAGGTPVYYYGFARVVAHVSKLKYASTG
jgi:hypothetical protein